MAAKMEAKDGEQEEETPKILYWKLARDGISLLLNNKQEEAEALFKAHPDSLEMCTGYVYALFTDALMTFEDDKIQQCTKSMKELEKKCSYYTGGGWFRSVRSKVFGNDSSSAERELQSQIILADMQIFNAMFTFLQHDIGGFIKGGWMLRKSYKLYYAVFTTILQLYKEIVGDENVPPISEKMLKVSLRPSISNAVNPTLQESVQLASSMEQKLPEAFDPNPSARKAVESAKKSPSKKTASVASPADNRKGSVAAGASRDPQEKTPPARQQDATNEPQDVVSAVSSVVAKRRAKEILANGYIGGDAPKHSFSVHADLGSVAREPDESCASDAEPEVDSAMRRSASAGAGLRSPSSYFDFSSFNIFNSAVSAKDIDKDTITRLLCEVSFGFGLLQLGISLLPPAILKLVNFLGFGGNRKVGLANLMYARHGDDMRAPFATLALLWYHTIVRPFFALDGSKVYAGVHSAADLMDEVKAEFEESALFLFFKGRIERLRAEIPRAIKTFEKAMTNSTQNEVKLMSMHEVGWCYLIELDFFASEASFQYLKNQSRWSKAFYSYLGFISAGASEALRKSPNPAEIRRGFQPVAKGRQLDEFLTRRYKICPTDEETLKATRPDYWKLLVYELLYLWNSLPSCNTKNLRLVIGDCREVWKTKLEPFAGLSRLIEGSCHCILGKYEDGVKSFREGVEIRKSLPNNSDDAHISAFIKYELGLNLIKKTETVEEGKILLHDASAHYKNYDFEQRLTVRVHAILKSL